MGAQARFDIVQAFPMGDERTPYTPVLVLASESFDVTVSFVAPNTTAQCVLGEMFQSLSKAS